MTAHGEVLLGRRCCLLLWLVPATQIDLQNNQAIATRKLPSAMASSRSARLSSLN
jgi:hypothetical protein